MNQPLILASTSSRRKEILTMLGLTFTPVSPQFDEDAIKPTTDPEKYVIEIAEGKGKSMEKVCPDNAIILAADTTVWLNDKPIGKPQSQKEAHEILRALQGRTHSVWSGIWVKNNQTGNIMTETVQTHVEMKHMNDREISWYIDAEYVLDKAGAYGIQGKGACFISQIEGDFYNVVGLPVAVTVDLLRSAGLSLFTSD